uniref:General transcription factor IIA, 1-like n=1 Tax=Knipowitschia caucasica TaxID=637954 RepID=A0AAV2JKY3_KNICA
MRELFLDEGIEDRVLDDLRHLWESKMMQSKALEDFRKNNINSSNFVLQLPASYTHNDQDMTVKARTTFNKVSASVVIPTSQKVQSYPVKTTSETVATFSLPAGLTYPVQIPAGVTLQTASGQLYKVNVPVVVTQAPAGQQPLTHPAPKVPQSQMLHIRVSTAPVQKDPPMISNAAVSQATAVTLPPKTNTAPIQEPVLPPQPPTPPTPPTPQIDVEDEDILETPSPELETKTEDCDQPLNLSMNPSPAHVLDFQMNANTTDIDDLLKEVIEKEREKVRYLDPTKADDDLGLDLDYGALADIVQLDGAADNSEEEVGALEENDFLGMINAEAIRALQEGDSDGLSSSSDSDGAEDELAHVEDEDPLNSGDDVVEQDIPNLFDTENVIVCQYDKIHRSKNRWKFHLKDGVMTYGGRDYVFSKAVGEAEW